MKTILFNCRQWVLTMVGLGMILALPWAPARALAADTHGATAPAGHVEAPADANGAVAVPHGHGNGVPDASDWLTRFGYSYLTAYMFCLSLCAARTHQGRP